MSVTTESKSAEVPDYLKDFCGEIRGQRFALVGSDMVLVMGLYRSYYKSDFDTRPYRATCSLHITIEPVDAAKRADRHLPISRIQFSNHLNSGDSLGMIHVSGHRHGLRMMLPNGEVDPIDPTERDRLLAFLNELRGIQLKYVANIFGFLEKDGSDKEIVTELRFPHETCDTHD